MWRESESESEFESEIEPQDMSTYDLRIGISNKMDKLLLININEYSEHGIGTGVECAIRWHSRAWAQVYFSIEIQLFEGSLLIKLTKFYRIVDTLNSVNQFSMYEWDFIIDKIR